MKSKTSATLVIVLTFLLGVIAGAVGNHLVFNQVIARAPGGMDRTSPHNIAEDLAKGLSLDGQQRDKLKVIIDESRERYKSLSLQFRPQYESIRNESRQQIRQMLTEDQKAKFEKMVKEIDERHKNHPRRPGD